MQPALECQDATSIGLHKLLQIISLQLIYQMLKIAPDKFNYSEHWVRVTRRHLSLRQTRFGWILRYNHPMW